MSTFVNRAVVIGIVALLGGALIDADSARLPHTLKAYAVFSEGNFIDAWVLASPRKPDVIIGLPREYGNPFRNANAA